MLPGDLQVAVIEGGRLHVGDVGFAFLVEVVAAGRGDPLGPAQVHHPAHHVDHVNAHVANGAVAVFHVIAPAAGMDALVERPHRRRAGPHLVVEVFRRRLVGRVADAAPAVAIGLHQPDPAQAAFLDQFARLEQVRRAAPLRAHLHHPLVLARRRHHGLAFDHVHADRFLHIDVGPGLHRRDHRQRMPVIRRGDQHDVQVLLLEHFAVIAVGARFLLRKLAAGHDVGRLGQHAACPRRRARPPRPARPGSGAAGPPCHTSRCRSARPVSSGRPVQRQSPGISSAPSRQIRRRSLGGIFGGSSVVLSILHGDDLAVPHDIGTTGSSFYRIGHAPALYTHRMVPWYGIRFQWVRL